MLGGISRRLCVAAMLLTVFSVGALPTAQAAPACTDQADLSLQTIHVRQVQQGAEIWEETNEVPGLQTATCVTQAGTDVEPDDLVQEAPPELPDIPDLGGYCISPAPGQYLCIT